MNLRMEVNNELKKIILSIFLIPLFLQPNAYADPKENKPLYARLVAEDMDIRKAALDDLNKLDADSKAKLVSKLIKTLSNKNEYFRENSADALAKIGPLAIKAVPSLIKTLKDKVPEVRLFAAFALGEIGSKDAIPALTKATKDTDKEVDVAGMAKEALKKIQGIKEGEK